jgi:hypothetical protein
MPRKRRSTATTPKPPWHGKPGRTISQALAAGNFYGIQAPGWGHYEPPAATSPEEVLAWAKATFTNIPPGTTFQAYRIKEYWNPKWIEDVGTLTA